MSNLTREDFYRVFKVLCEIFDKKFTPYAADVYYKLLSKYTAKELNEASFKLLETYKYPNMPMPAYFIEIIQNKRKQEYMNQDSNIKQIHRDYTPEEEKLRQNSIDAFKNLSKKEAK